MAAILQNSTVPKPHHLPLPSALFSAVAARTIQARWKKRPTTTAVTRLHSRIRDPKLDPLTSRIVRLNRILNLHRFLSARKRGPFVSLRLLSRWAPHAGLPQLPVGEFLRKYPHVFDVFTHPVRKNACFKFQPGFLNLLEEEEIVKHGEDFELQNVAKIKKIMMMSVRGRLHFHALRLSRREFGLPEDFRECIIQKYADVFRVIDMEVFELVDEDGESSLAVAEVEKWRETEFKEKWLSEFEVKYAFPMNFPTGFKKEPGFKDKLRNWQRLAYAKPYEKTVIARGRSRIGIGRYEKRAVAVIHELLCLTVEKMLEVHKLVHFRKDLGIEVNIRELLLEHPGMFYLSTKGNIQMVFLREAYNKGCLIEPNPLYEIRRKLLDLIFLGRRSTRVLRNETRPEVTLSDSECESEASDENEHEMSWNEIEREASSGEEHAVTCLESEGEDKMGDFVIPFLEHSVNHVEEERTAHQEQDNHFNYKIGNVHCGKRSLLGEVSRD